MQVRSRSDLPAIAFKHWWVDDSEIGVVVQKATFAELWAARPEALAEQPPLRLADAFHDGPASSTLAESDLAPHKPRTDLTLNAVARAPEGRALADWPVRVAVTGRLAHTLHVTGPRLWERRRGAWRLAPPEPVCEVPVRYERAFGGAGEDGSGRPAPHPYNPIGRGLLTAHARERELSAAGPQLGLLAELVAADGTAPLTVCGLGPLGRTWLPRRALAGTFDQAWTRTRHPRMPADYQFAYWNAAPSALQLDPYLVGDETVALTGLRADPRPQEIRLPGAQAFFRLHRTEGAPSDAVAMVLDTVHLDVADADPSAHVLTLVWRGWFADPGGVALVETILRRPGDR